MDYLEIIMLFGGFVLFTIGSISINKTLKTKSSLLLVFIPFVCIIVTFIYSVSENYLIVSYEANKAKILINSIFVFYNKIFPNLLIFLSGIGFYGIAKNIKDKKPQLGSRGFLSPSPHNTLHAGPHRAFRKGYRAVAG